MSWLRLLLRRFLLLCVCYLSSDRSSSWPSFIHITWMLGSDTSHSKMAFFFSVIFMSLIFLVNSMTRAKIKDKKVLKFRMLQLLSPFRCATKRITFNEEVGAGRSRAGHELILAAVSEMDVADSERVRELAAADLAAV